MKKPFEQAPAKGDLQQQKPGNANERRQPGDINEQRAPGKLQSPGKPTAEVKPGDAPKQPERSAQVAGEKQESKNS